MSEHGDENHTSFREALEGLKRGDFTSLDPLFEAQISADPRSCRILEWYERGYFEGEPEALAEALSCACFNGRTKVVDILLREGVDPLAGAKTGMNGFHWAADRGHLDTVRLLIERRVPMEVKNMYGGTVLGCTVWSALHEPRADHLSIVEALLAAGAKIEGADYPTGNERIDELLRKHGSGRK